jgi:hypothetical protein
MTGGLRKREAERVYKRMVKGEDISLDELIKAAKFFFFRTVRRTKKEKIWTDLGMGLDLLRKAGLPDIPDDPRKKWGPDPCEGADRACDWFYCRFGWFLKEEK